MSQRIIDRTMQEWAKGELENLGENTRLLISDLNADLYGLGESESYEGFIPSIKKLSSELEDIREKFVDIDCEQVLDSLRDYEDPECEVDFSSIYELKRKEVLRYLVGSELASYI